MQVTKAATLALLVALPACASAAGIYKCTAATGRVTYTDAPCKGAGGTTVNLPPLPTAQEQEEAVVKLRKSLDEWGARQEAQERIRREHKSTVTPPLTLPPATLPPAPIVEKAPAQ